MAMLDASDTVSTRPYLIRALYEWCTDNGYTPFIAVHVKESVQVPMEYVRDGEIVLNISFEATSGLNIGNDYIQFKGRFGGVAHDIVVPVQYVLAIYARETGQGMAFPVVTLEETEPDPDAVENAVAGKKPQPSLVGVPAPASADAKSPTAPRPPTGNKPTLTRIK